MDIVAETLPFPKASGAGVASGRPGVRLWVVIFPTWSRGGPAEALLAHEHAFLSGDTGERLVMDGDHLLVHDGARGGFVHLAPAGHAGRRHQELPALDGWGSSGTGTATARDLVLVAFRRGGPSAAAASADDGAGPIERVAGQVARADADPSSTRRLCTFALSAFERLDPAFQGLLRRGIAEAISLHHGGGDEAAARSDVETHFREARRDFQRAALATPWRATTRELRSHLAAAQASLPFAGHPPPERGGRKPHRLGYAARRATAVCLCPTATGLVEPDVSFATDRSRSLRPARLQVAGFVPMERVRAAAREWVLAGAVLRPEVQVRSVGPQAGRAVVLTAAFDTEFAVMLGVAGTGRAQGPPATVWVEAENAEVLDRHGTTRIGASWTFRVVPRRAGAVAVRVFFLTGHLDLAMGLCTFRANQS